ncbi:MAG: hypothetical protein WBA91_06440 [Paracoccaceae bacterium]
MSDGAISGQVIHATTVACLGQGVIILGPSGSGKSGLALGLMAYGATLVADDQTEIQQRDGRLWATAPAPLRGMIEARGIGILSAEPAAGVTLSLAIDLGRAETERLPPLRNITLFDHPLPCLYKVTAPHFSAMILQYLKAGRFS